MLKRKLSNAERSGLMARMCSGRAANIVPLKLKRPEARTAKALGSYAIGSVALGALATAAIYVGSFAVGRLAVGRLTMREGRIKRLRIDDLEVGRLQLMPQEPTSAASRNGEKAKTEMEAVPVALGR